MHRKLSLLQDPFELTTSSLSGHLLARKLGREKRFPQKIPPQVGVIHCLFSLKIIV